MFHKLRRTSPRPLNLSREADALYAERIPAGTEKLADIDLLPAQALACGLTFQVF